MSVINDQISELSAARAQLTPQIRGLEDLTRVSLSPPSIAVVQEELQDRLRRASLLEQAVAMLQALLLDGYPALPKAQASKEVYDELLGQMSDFTAAVGEIAPLPTMTVALGTPVAKP